MRFYFDYEKTKKERRKEGKKERREEKERRKREKRAKKKSRAARGGNFFFIYRVNAFFLDFLYLGSKKMVFFRNDLETLKFSKFKKNDKRKKKNISS